MNHENRQTLQMETNYKIGTLIEKIENLRHDLKSRHNKNSKKIYHIPKLVYHFTYEQLKKITNCDELMCEIVKLIS